MSGVHRWYGYIDRMEIDGDAVRVTLTGPEAEASKVELLRRWDVANPPFVVPCTITLGTSPHYVWVVTLVECSIGYVDSITLWESEPEALAHAAALAKYADAGCRWEPRGGKTGSGCWLEMDEGDEGRIMRTITTGRHVPGKGDG